MSNYRILSAIVTILLTELFFSGSLLFGDIVTRYNSTGVEQKTGATINSVWPPSTGDQIVLSGDTTSSGLSNSNYSFSIVSSDDTVRKISASGTTRFMDRAGNATYDLRNVQFSGFNNGNGAVFWDTGDNSAKITINAENVLFDGNSTAYLGSVLGTTKGIISITGTTTFTNNTATKSADARGGAIGINEGGKVIFSGAGSSATFSGNTDATGKNDIRISKETGSLTFQDKGVYFIGSGLAIDGALNILDGAEVTLGAGSVNTIAKTTLSNGGALIVQPNANNVVTSAERTVFKTDATQTVLSGTIIPQSPSSTMTAIGVDTNLFSSALADGTEILVATGAAVAAIQKPIIQTYNDNGFLAVLKTNANEALTVGLVPTSSGNTVYRVAADGTLTKAGTTINGVATASNPITNLFDEGDTVILTDNVSHSGTLNNNENKTLTIQSSTNDVRTITATGTPRFMDRAMGTYYLSNLNFTNFNGNGNGSVFWGAGKINLYCSNVSFDSNSNSNYSGGVLGTESGTITIIGTTSFTNNSAKAGGGAIGSTVSGTILFAGDGSSAYFSGNKVETSNNDIQTPNGLVVFQDKGTYELNGGIKAADLTVKTGANVTLESGSISTITGALIVDANSSLTICLNNANVVESGTTTYSSGATQTTLGTHWTVAGAGNLTLDLAGITTVSGKKDILAFKGDFSASVPQFQIANQSSGYFICDTIADANSFRLAVQEKIGSNTIYQYGANRQFIGSSTSLDTLSVSDGDLLMLTGEATAGHSVDLSGKYLTIRSADELPQTIAAASSGTGAGPLFTVSDGQEAQIAFHNIRISGFQSDGAGAIRVGSKAQLILSGANASIEFANNINTNSSVGNDITVETGGTLTVSDSGTYRFGSGLAIDGALNILDGAKVTLGAGSVNTIAKTTLSNGGALIVQPNENNVVATTERTVFTTDATKTVLSGTIVPQSPSSTMTAIGVDTSLFSSALTDGTEILVATGAAVGAIQKPIIQTYNDNGFLAVLKTNANEALTVGLVTKTTGHKAYLVAEDGTLKGSSTTINGAAGSMASGDTFIVTTDFSATSNINSSGKTLTVQSSTNDVRTITGSSVVRFMDYANGTTYLSNLKFEKFGKDSGCVFWNGSGEIAVYGDNVEFYQNKSGFYTGAVLACNSGNIILAGTMDFIENQAKSNGGAISINGTGNLTFKGDGSVMSFVGNKTNSGSENSDIFVSSGTVTFQDKGTYVLNGGIKAPTVQINNAANVTFGPESVNTISTLNVSGGSALTLGALSSVGTFSLASESVLELGTDSQAALLSVTSAMTLDGTVNLDLFADGTSDGIAFSGTASDITLGTNAAISLSYNEPMPETRQIADYSLFSGLNESQAAEILDKLDLSTLPTWTDWCVSQSGVSGRFSVSLNANNSAYVPEPATWTLLLFGLAGVWYLRRRTQGTFFLGTAYPWNAYFQSAIKRK